MLTTWRGAVRVVHPFPVAVVTATGTVLFRAISTPAPSAGTTARVALVILLTQIPVGALNDLVDRHHDAIYQPEKPIPMGELLPSAALIMAVGALILLLPAALTFGVTSLVLIEFATAGGIVYDLWLQRTPLSVLGYLVGFLGLLTWVWFVAGALQPSVLLLYPPAGALVTAAHLAQAYPDIESDQLAGHHGLAAWLGPRAARRLMFLLYAATLPLVSGAAILRFPVALLPVALSVLLAGAAARRPTATRADRLAGFHLFAPALALLGIAAVMAGAR